MKRETPNSRELLTFALLLMAVVITVIITFKIISERRVAALVAGSQFIILGGFLLYRSAHWNHRYKSPLFWSSLFFLFGVALPMVFQRIRYWDLDFNQISIWGIPGPQFHGMSNAFYILLLAAVGMEWVRLRILARGA